MPIVELSLADLPWDSPIGIEREGFRLVIIRSRAGVFAYQDRCPHAYWPLSQGTLRRDVLECPGHGWEFDVVTGRCLTTPGHCLSPVALSVREDVLVLQWDHTGAREPAAGVCSSLNRTATS